ncbi:hypothetical protein GQR58_014115 [Nymphon striatum]|nr:hypothetical protein GQR58_014115 [Nymphon striatum]
MSSELIRGGGVLSNILDRGVPAAVSFIVLSPYHVNKNSVPISIPDIFNLLPIPIPEILKWSYINSKSGVKIKIQNNFFLVIILTPSILLPLNFHYCFVEPLVYAVKLAVYQQLDPLIHEYCQLNINWNMSICNSFQFNMRFVKLATIVLFLHLGWMLGLQVMSGISTTTFIICAVYRSASLYHPQRRAILHLKSLQKRMKQRSLVFAFVGLAYILGCCAFGFFVHHRTTECMISRTYLSIISLLVMGLVVLSYRNALHDYQGKVVFAWIYGVFFGGYSYSIKMAALDKIRHRIFDRGHAVLNFSNSLSCYLGIPIGVYLNIFHNESGYIFSATCLLLGMAVLFFTQMTDKSSTQLSDTHSFTSGYCRRCSDISNSIYGPNSCKSSSSTHQTSGIIIPNANNVGDQKCQSKVDVKKSELTCISEEACLDNISEVYQYYGDCITSCNNAEGYLGISEYENNWNQTCQNIVMDHDQKMTRVRKKSVAVNSDKGFDTCPDCYKLRPCITNGRCRTNVPRDQPITETEEHETSEEL